MNEVNVIEGRSIFPDKEAGKIKGSAADKQTARHKKLLEDLATAMDKLQIDPRECILEITDKGLVMIGDASVEWVLITDFKIKPIEKGFRSLVNFYDTLSYDVEAGKC